MRYYLSDAELTQRTSLIELSESTASLRRARSAIGKDVFLSYSSFDAHRISGVIDFLEDFDASVYIDKRDPLLPLAPSSSTASILYRRIMRTPRFILLVSPSSRQSRWIPWELGLAHGARSDVEDIAILPITPTFNENGWPLREYLGLYPFIGKENGEWRVFDPRDNKYWRLADWLP